MSLDSKGLAIFSRLSKSEPFQDNNTMDWFCKNGGVINKPVTSILWNLFSLVLLWATYCVMPKKLKIPILIIYGILMILPIYDIMQMFTLNNKQMEEKCKKLLTGKLRNSGLFSLYNFVNFIVGVIV